MARAFKIEPGGNIAEYVIPPEGITLKCGGVILGGEEDAEFEKWILPRVAAIVGRITPFATCWLSPTYTHDATGASAYGTSFSGSDIVIMRSNLSKHDSIDTAYHECAHLIEDNITKEFLDIWTGAIEKQKWDHEYFDRKSERRANLFERYAGFLDHGGTLVIEPGAISELLHLIYIGHIGKQIVAARAAIASRANPLAQSWWGRFTRAA